MISRRLLRIFLVPSAKASLEQTYFKHSVVGNSFHLQDKKEPVTPWPEEPVPASWEDRDVPAAEVFLLN